jgi:hypothetical protein
VVPNVPAGIDTKGSDEISNLSGNGSGIAGVRAGDRETNAANAGVMVQVTNAKEEKSIDIEDVEISMEANSNTVSTSNTGSPMEESSGVSIWDTGAVVANAVVVDVAEEGSSMDKGTPKLGGNGRCKHSLGGANTTNADNVVDAVAEEGSSLDKGTPNSVEMEDVSSGSVGGTNTTNADNVNGDAEE